MGKGKKLTCYLEACVLIDFIEHPITEDPARTIAGMLADADEGRIDLVTSTLTIAEVWYAKKELDGKALSKDVTDKLNRLWHPGSSPIRLVDVHELIVREANKLLREKINEGWSKTGGYDAIHLITAQREKVDEFLTTEHAMSKWGSILGFKVCPPHHEEEQKESTSPLFSELPNKDEK